MSIEGREPEDRDILVPRRDLPVDQHLRAEDGGFALVDGQHALAQPHLRAQRCVLADCACGLDRAPLVWEGRVHGLTQPQDHRLVGRLFDLVGQNIDDDLLLQVPGSEGHRARRQRRVARAGLRRAVAGVLVFSGDIEFTLIAQFRLELELAAFLGARRREGYRGQIRIVRDRRDRGEFVHAKGKPQFLRARHRENDSLVRLVGFVIRGRYREGGARLSRRPVKPVVLGRLKVIV